MTESVLDEESQQDVNNTSITDLSLELIKENLSVLGKHPQTQIHAYLQLKCVQKGIQSISLLRSFPLLVYIDLSDNCIEDLTPLEAIRCLCQLNLRKNKLKTCLQYFVPKCSSIDKWSSGQYSVGSMLTLANLSNNEILEIQDISHHPYLEVLLLESNNISRISGLSSLRYLKVLNLSNNNISVIEGLDGLLIQELNLSRNSLETLNGLNNLKRLSVLNVSDNQISSLGPLTMCQELYTLDISQNKLTSIRQVEFLCDMKWLKYLNLMDNPCYMKKFYRNRVIYRLLQLQSLDLMTISAEEKIQAFNIHKAEGGDLSSRMNTFNKYFPNEEFQDYFQSFEDDEIDISASDLYDGR